jgi:hypothetical protein
VTENVSVGVIEKKNLGAKHCKLHLLTASLQHLLFSDSNASETQRWEALATVTQATQ